MGRHAAPETQPEGHETWIETAPWPALDEDEWLPVWVQIGVVGFICAMAVLGFFVIILYLLT